MKISPMQIFWIIFTFETGNMLLLSVNPAIIEAKQDAWISSFFSIILGVVILFIANKVTQFYPGKTLIEFSKLILGKWIGTIIIFIYFIQWYSVIGNILGEFSQFTITILLPQTPSWSLILTMMIIIIYINYIGGIEGIGRCSEVFGALVLTMVIFLVFLTIPNLDFQKLLPIYSENGFLPILKGSLSPLSFLGESVLIMMLVAFMDEPRKSLSRAIWGIVLSGIFVSTSIITTLMIFGPQISSKLLFPAIDMVRFISIMNFIQNLEIIAVLIWILSVFIKLSLYFFAASYGTAQLLKLKDWKKAIWFVAIVTFVLAVQEPTVTLFGIQYVKEYWVKYVLPINMVGIPMLLLIVGSIRKGLAADKKA
ncbi:endospore germination permease [Bacillus sp. S/N-304-OC-R1]|uniref:GerAB/ArcD/ProY family transporter n=1 Tax=Bacillus sp. S/N-304-OC-R1 TaxID=2758034 RepID=UPI001C8DB876|nr:endospore germination permease [Bacillus sp. S/N-304-OC-R1]MBY0120470.1 endospore germination permease [Bacillus sp. S/N-304-OC-R1]